MARCIREGFGAGRAGELEANKRNLYKDYWYRVHAHFADDNDGSGGSFSAGQVRGVVYSVMLFRCRAGLCLRVQEMLYQPSSPERKVWGVPMSSDLLALLVCGVLASGASAQEPSATVEFSVPAGASTRRGSGQPTSSAFARQLPDALKFADGLLRQKKYDLAAEEYERFAQSGAREETWTTPRFGLANARLYQGKFREARRAFDEFLSGTPADPRRLTARYRLGELAYLLGDLPAARQSLEEFRAATSDHAGLEMALTYLGDTYFGLQDFAQAHSLSEVAGSLSPWSAGRASEIWPGPHSGGSGGPGAARSGSCASSSSKVTPNGPTGPGCKPV